MMGTTPSPNNEKLVAIMAFEEQMMWVLDELMLKLSITTANISVASCLC